MGGAARRARAVGRPAAEDPRLARGVRGRAAARSSSSEAGVDELEDLRAQHELVVVATGKGTLGGIFARDPEKSPYDTPQRALALTYVDRDDAAAASISAVCFNVMPGVGEYFVFPALTTTAPCEIMVFEGIPRRADGLLGRRPHARSSTSTAPLELLERFLPWEAERCR